MRKNSSLLRNYVKAKEMADQGAFGKLYLVKQSEKNSALMRHGSGTSIAPAAEC
jgi:hypothetical protein